MGLFQLQLLAIAYQQSVDNYSSSRLGSPLKSSLGDGLEGASRWPTCFNRHRLGHFSCSVGALTIVLSIATAAEANTAWDTTLKPTQPDKVTPFDRPLDPGQIQSAQLALSAQVETQNRLEQLRRLQAGIERDRLTQDPQEQAQIEQLRRELATQAGSVNASAVQPTAAQPTAVQPTTAQSTAAQPTAANPAADGVYLYGQQPMPDQLETAYFVFEAQAGAVTGALYMPSSSFDCVQGHISGDQMALNVTNSYSQETYAYALDLDTSVADVASQQGAAAASLSISGFHPLPVSDRDRELLATCQASYSS